MSAKYLQLLTEEQRENVRKEVNCTRESVKKDVQYLCEWMEKQPHLSNFTDEDIVAHILLNCKNSLEKTKNCLSLFYEMKIAWPEIFFNRNPFDKEVQEQTKRGMYVPLRKLTPDGYRVFILYHSDEYRTMTDFSPSAHFKITQMTTELLGKLDCMKGVILVHDGKNITMPMVAAFATTLQKSTFLHLKAMKIRYQKLYFCNMGPAIDMGIKIAKPLLTKTIASRIEVLKDPTDLCKVLPKDIIPRDYGGDELPLVQLKDMWYQDLKDNYEFFKLNETEVSDFSKTPQNFVQTHLSGLDGSFRQLSCD